MPPKTGIDSFIKVFNENGTFTVPDGVESVDVLIVGGGGGGGSRQGGGGGAGGLRVLSNHTVIAGASIPVTVGAGGIGVSEDRGQNGGDSSFDTIVAQGGGGGGSRNENKDTGLDGGCGGGGGGKWLSGQGYTTAGTGSQGSNGGRGGWVVKSNVGGVGGGGGGGAGNMGTDAVVDGSEVIAGNGGDGIFFEALTDYGDAGWFSGGGGGAKNVTGVDFSAGGKGGKGGGARSGYPANESTTATLPSSALANTGGGGGATFLGDSGGKGGSGVVIVMYPSGQLPPIIHAERAITVTI